MIQKPILMPNQVKSQDYSGFIRQNMGRNQGGEHLFAQTMTEQNAAQGAAGAEGGTLANAAAGAGAAVLPGTTAPRQNPVASGDLANLLTDMASGNSNQSGFGGKASPFGPMPSLASLHMALNGQIAGEQIPDGPAAMGAGDARPPSIAGTSAGTSRGTPQQTTAAPSNAASGAAIHQQPATINAAHVPAEGLPLRNQSRGMAIHSTGGIALDNRALSTLQRMEQNPNIQRARGRSSVKNTTDDGSSLGTLSARYESGNKGSAAIGYDRNGGTSYGKYQISSKQGSFDQFLQFLSKEAPDIGERLSKAGKPNTGGTRGAVPNEWKAIAEEHGVRFENLQEGFIRASHYQPALEGVEGSLGIQLSDPMREVLWSTAVQHGPTGAKRIFNQAVQQLERKGKDASDEKALIETVYNVRKGQFASSTPAVQSAVRQRFDEERGQALAMLKDARQVA